MLGELDFYLPKSFCSTNVYGEYTEGKISIVGLVQSKGSKKIDVAYVPPSKAWVSHQIHQLHRECVGTNVGPQRSTEGTLSAQPMEPLVSFI